MDSGVSSYHVISYSFKFIDMASAYGIIRGRTWRTDDHARCSETLKEGRILYQSSAASSFCLQLHFMVLSLNKLCAHYHNTPEDSASAMLQQTHQTIMKAVHVLFCSLPQFQALYFQPFSHIDFSSICLDEGLWDQGDQLPVGYAHGILPGIMYL